jgi:hypothetical protein
MAERYTRQLMEWLPGVKSTKLLQKGTGAEPAVINAFIDAAQGRANTVTFIEHVNGNAICGGFLAPAWVHGTEGWDIHDPDQKSFIFTLKNHASVAPMKFPKRREGRAAFALRGGSAGFGQGDGVKLTSGDNGTLGTSYEALGQTASIFWGGEAEMRAGRWELWAIA